MARLGRFEDDRGVIEDLLATSLDSVTRIFTREGAVRGNHVHKRTTQWTYVVSGRLMIATGDPGELSATTYGPGELAREAPGIPHAWQALEDTTVLVFTKGPRSGTDYESDTIRLEVPLL